MREFELLDRHEIDNLLDLEEAKEERKASRLSKLPDALQTILLGRMAQADAQGLIDSLTELRKGDPHLYAEAMRALQVPFGNQAVNQLHEQIVSGARSREAEPPNIVSTAAYLKGRAVEVGLPAVEGTAGQPALEDPEFLRTLDADFAALRVELDRIGSLPHVNTQEALEQVLSLRRQWGDRGEQLAAQPEWRQRVDGAYREVVERVILRAMESSDQDGQLKFHMDSQGQSDLVGLLQQIGVDQEFFKRHGLDLEFLREQGPALMSSMFDKLGKAQWQAEIPTGAPEMGARRSRRASPVGAEPGVRININLGKILQNLFQPEIARLASKLGMAGQDVHIHSDETSRQITESRGATGVAMGDVIHLHPERVEPSSDEGRRVLAHEMAHLAQAELPGTEYSSETALDAEIEADEFSRSYVAGEAVSLPEVSRAPMAMAADVDAAQLTEEEKKRRQDRARALPASLKTTMEKAFRTDFSTVKVYEGDQASQMGALAYTQGEEIHFGPGQYEPDSQSGRELLGHELAHVVQQREGRVASQSSRGDYAVNQDSHLEAEADQQGALAAQGVEVAGGPTMAIGPEVESMADAQATPQAMLDSSAPIQMQEGEEAAEVKIKMAGDMYQIRRGGDQARLVKDIRWEPVSGLVLTQADLEFNGDDIVRGNLRGSLVVGEYVSAESITLSVNSNGTVDTSISNARLTVGDLIVGAIDCRISANGISGKATINPDQITVGNNLVVKGGSMELKLDTTGNIQAKGTLTLEVAGIGDLTLKAKLDNTSLSGKMTLKLAEPLELVTGVKLETVSLEGDYNKEAFELRGKVKLDVLQWAKAEITGSFKYPEKTWSATGTLTQSKAYTAGELEISKGELTVNLENGDLKEVKGRADFAYKQWNGDVKGTYDVPSSSFTGDGKVQLTDPLSFSGGGIKLLSAKGEVKVKDNALTEVTGSASAEIPYEGQPRFKVSVERATIDVPASEFSGKGSAELIPTLTISAGNTTVTLKAGKVSAEVEKNRFKRADIQQKIEAEVTTDFAERTITLQGGVEAGSIEGTQISCDASLNLKSPISWEKGDVKATLKTGSIKVKLEQNVLQSTKFDAEANLSVSNIEGASEPLRLKGRLSGEYKPSGIDIDTTVNLEPPFTWEKGDVGVTLTSGSVKLDVKSGVLQSFQFATKAQVEVKNIKGASGPLQLAGQLGGEYKQSGLDLDTTVDLMPPFVFGKDNVTATFNSGSVKLDVKKSKFKSFKADVDANVVIDKIEGAKAGPLNLHSKTTIGYTPEGLDIDADLKLVPPFVFGKNNVTATFNSGKVALKVEKSKFKS
ncbi:MAG: DUF4157 domain-containing protein, partial [Bradymonadales bacterium]|nr:DUF4157 domain-containing protein [Bradymonadales bacterium]